MKIRLSLVSAALLVGALPVALSAPAACAAETPHAALVVDTGEADVALCVELPDSSVSGIELIRLAGEQHGLQYTLGYGGKAVCKLAGVGPEGDDCFADYPDFWGYWRGDGSGGWSWSSTGAGTTTVEDGDVEGWSWGSGQDGSTHQPPPPTTIETACSLPEEDPGEKEPDEASTTDHDDPQGSSDPNAGGSNRPASQASDDVEGESRPSSGSNGEAEPRERDRSPGETEPEPSEVADPTPEAPEPHVALVAGSDETDEQGPPIVGLVGLGLAIGLGITAAAMTAARRRRGG